MPMPAATATTLTGSLATSALPGLFDKCTGPTVLHLALEGCGAPRPEDVSRIAAGLALGVYGHGAVPGLSLEARPRLGGIFGSFCL